MSYEQRLKAAVQSLKERIFRRSPAFRRVFDADRRDAEVVLAVLAKFCRADSSTFSPDPHIAARLDGRREVWLLIQNYANLTPERLWEIYGRKDLE